MFYFLKYHSKQLLSYHQGVVWACFVSPCTEEFYTSQEHLLLQQDSKRTSELFPPLSLLLSTHFGSVTHHEDPV